MENPPHKNIVFNLIIFLYFNYYIIMKIIFAFLFFNLFVFTTTLSVPSTPFDVIYDSAGNKLLRGIPYYILPLLSGSGGGLTLSQNTKNECPLNVTQEFFEANKGVPFTFNPIVIDDEFIRGAYPTLIEADVENPCHESNIWMVSTAGEAKKKHDERLTDNKDKKKKDVAPVQIVTTGGKFNKPESCFQIVEDDMMPGVQSYQIQYCPFKCGPSSKTLTCYNVGLISDADGKRYLAPTDALFPVVFRNSLDKFSRSAKRSKFSQLSTTRLADQKNEVE